jgi:uncharacterized membrane protein
MRPWPAREPPIQRCARLEQTVADFALGLSFPERLKLADAMKRGTLHVAPPPTQ